MGSGHILKHLKTVHQNSVYHCATAAQVKQYSFFFFFFFFFFSVKCVVCFQWADIV